ncbi:MAG: ANTAR domain-containing protein [Chromatiales bacterium]|nr:ANTAR domain-containing protein [Chromatiales bacterium]
MSLSVVVAERNEARADALVADLREYGHRVLAQLSGFDGLAATVSHEMPDVLVIGRRRPDAEFFSLLGKVQIARNVPTVLIADDVDRDTVDQLAHSGVGAFLVDETSALQLDAVVRIAHARFSECAQVRTDLAETRAQLDERKLVERAKGMLMNRRGLSENDAYHLLRRLAMQRNQRMGAIARGLLDSAELLG